ncbi:ABC transporter substrate-binding protein [Marinicellulosiphila megalodicopiae]|uniref:ABC transporter substrate-binding protein n=1 Tax=Marinicellulosiphila megalodicopiae TaxID=2724896 RepID=UPI003BAE31C4
MVLIYIISIVSPLAFSDALIIGLDADMSAVAKLGGQAIERGALLAIDEINANGGVLGKQLKLVVKDHRGNPARGVDNILDFAKIPNLVGILGGVHTPVVLSELKAIHDNKIVFISAWAAGTSIIDNGYDPNFVFRVSVRDEHAGLVLIQHAQKKGANKIALLLERTGWGRSNEVSIKNAAQKFGIQISDIQWFNWQENSMQDQILHIKNSGAQAIILVANAPEGAVIVNDLIKLNMQDTTPIISHWGLASGSFVDAAGLDAINQIDLTVLQTFSFLEKNNELLQSVFLAYQKAYEPDIAKIDIPAQVGVAQGYDAVQLLAQAINQAGTTNSIEIKKALESGLHYSGLIKQYAPAFSESTHEALELPDYLLSQFNQNGRLVPIENIQ